MVSGADQSLEVRQWSNAWSWACWRHCSFPTLPTRAHCAPLSPCHTFWMADTVFIGRAQSVVEKTRGNQVTRLVVEEWLRGARFQGEVTTYSYGVGGSCDFGFKQGSRYLVHATKDADGAWKVSLCGGTGLLDQSEGPLRVHPGRLGASWRGDAVGLCLCRYRSRHGREIGICHFQRSPGSSRLEP